jgi:hypothetical protein
MSRWLKVAEDLFRGRVSEPSPFEVDCACGRKVTGVRTKAAQTQACPVCQTRLFVLPACVYPQPRASQRKVALAPPRPEPAKEPNLVEPQSVNPESAAPESIKPPAATLAQPTRKIRAPAETERKPGAVSSNARDSLPAAASKVADAANRERLRRKLFSPVRLVLAGAALVVVLTVCWIWHLSALSQAERTVVAATKQAELALEEHDLEEAARQFRQVQYALDVLGRNDSRARGMRQTAAELSAAADLARSSLFDILHEASSLPAGAARESWAATFRSNYRDEWVVLDARVSRIVDAAGGRRYDIDFHLADGSLDSLNQAVIVADLPAFDKVISRETASGGDPQRVIFAAQLDDCSQDPKDAHVWRIVLRPSTGFLWSSVQHLELAGVTADDETKQLLAEQTTRLGIAP